MSQPVAVITGGTSGIGLASAHLFLKQGYNVAIFGQSQARLDALQQTYTDTVLTFQGDVGKPEALDAFYAACAARWRTIDVVIANAGIAVAEDVGHVSEADFDRTMNTNVKGVFFTVQKAIPYLTKGAALVLVSSIQANKGAGAWTVYGATKAAVRSMSRSFASTLGPKGIRVNTLSPGVTETPIFKKFGFADKELQTILKHVEDQTPLGRIGSPEEIAKAVFFLATDASSFMTGSDVQVDGGLAQI